jgi:LysR family transcriptional regulator, glycine cleavage system transcriptional activator
MSTPRRLRPPPMATLEAFDASVRLGSFSRAAEMLNLTPGAVSRQMAALEADLQVELFDRHARGISPTAAGNRLHSAVQQALSLVMGAARDLRNGGASSQEVRISLSPSIGARWLLPRLGRFGTIYPNIRVIPVADNRLVDLDVEQFDLAIRYTSHPDAGLESKLIMSEELCAVAAPRLLGTSPRGIEALDGLPFLHDQSEHGWRAWLDALGKLELLPAQGIVFNDYNLAVEAAVAGLGVIVGRSALIAEELRSGKLIAADPFRIVSPRAYYVVRPRRPPLPAAQMVWDWLAQEGQADSVL